MGDTGSSWVLGGGSLLIDGAQVTRFIFCGGCWRGCFVSIGGGGDGDVRVLMGPLRMESVRLVGVEVG